MPIVIGDYLKDTQHLDAERHGCYLLWLMHYWTKGPLPASIEELVTIGRLRGMGAPSIAQALLADFFTLDADGRYHQKRADKEKSKWCGKQLKAQEKASIAAQSRWKNHAPSNSPGNAPSNAQAMLERCPSPSPSQEELELTLLSPQATIRPEEFGNVWNRNCGGLPKIAEFTGKRRAKVKTRINQGITVERFTAAVKLCTEKPFLRGEGNRNWTATFDWLIDNDTNIVRVFEEEWGSNNGPQKPKLEILSRPGG